MNKLIRFLKPFTLMILMAVLLLYGQAMAELALPDYMSRIVNNGIQQSGIENAIPEIMTEQDFGNLLLLMTDEEKSEIESLYDRIEPVEVGYNEYEMIKNGEAIYKFREDAEISIDEIESMMSKALIIFSRADQSTDETIIFDGIAIPDGMAFYKFLSELPYDQRVEILDLLRAEFEDVEPTLLQQLGTKALNEYYTSIGVDIVKQQRNYILSIGGVMLLITMLGAAASISVGYISAKTAAGVGRNLRKSIFTKIESFSNQEIDQFSTASLITRSTNDVTQIQSLLTMMIRIIFYAPLIGIGGVIKALEKSTSMSWIIALAVIILVGMIMLVFNIALPKFKLVQKLMDRLNMVTRENLTGMMVIRAFNTQAFEENRFDKANKDLTETNLFVNRIMVFLGPAMMLIMNGTSLLIVWVGAHQIENSAMQVGDMMAFMQYALQIIFAFLMLSMMFIMIPRAIVSAQRISEVLDTEATILDPIDPITPDVKGLGEVVYKNVSFKFPGAQEDLIKDISFTAEPGVTTAIIGATGSGKTTLVNLLPRFYDVTEGEILVDGVNIKDMNMHDLREMIGYVPQKPALFSGTIESNLKYAREDATAAEVNEAIEIAQAADIIEEKTEGLLSEISQSGANISGGQKQRLSIARALIKKPKIFVIDDSFSALDFKTDSMLRKALKEKIGQSTVILIAQRIASIKHVEKIIVLEDGGICGIGKHEELMKQCEIYREIALSQLSEEELS